MIEKISKLASQQKKMSGAQAMGMIVTLEAFVIALAASEATTRPDPKAFIVALRKNAIEGSNRFGSQETATSAEEYADELIEEIVREAGVDMGTTK